MVKRYRQIPEEVKSKILAAALAPGCRVVDIARDYGVAAWTIYTWRKEAAAQSRSSATELSRARSVASCDPTTKFVELSVEGVDGADLDHRSSSQVCGGTRASGGSFFTLQKASLTFKDFSFIVEGNIRAAVLLKVIEILEEPLC